MKEIIKQVLNELGDIQINLGSDAARETIACLVSAALKEKGRYTELLESEIEEQKARETWVCEICGKNTYGVDFDYVGTGTNHLGCELELEMNIDKKTYDKMSNAVDVREKKWLQKNHR